MDYKVKELAREIAVIKEATLKLQKLSDNIPAVDKNADRILACVKMLEINITDVAEFDLKS